MSRPDLWRDDELAAGTPDPCGAGCRCASISVNRGRTPRKSATSPTNWCRSMIRVGRFDSRAMSMAVLTASVVVPAPPFAPKNDSVTPDRALSFAGRWRSDGALQRRLKASRSARRRSRSTTRRGTRWRPRASPAESDRARTRRRRRRSTSTATRRAGARSPRPTPSVPLRISTTARSGHVPPACFSSMIPIERPLERSSVVIVDAEVGITRGDDG